jgi:flavodoxin
MNTLVAYFSASGETKKLATTLAGVVNGDFFEIRPKIPYTDADLNWNDKKSRSTIEMTDTASRPAIAEMVADISQYDTIYIGFPIWWYEAPRIIQTFLESYDLSGKTVIPFATSGGSEMGNTDSILQRSAPAAHWKLGKRMRSDASVTEIAAWVKSLNS